jgi:hypothetical protein
METSQIRAMSSYYFVVLAKAKLHKAMMTVVVPEG